MCDDGLEDDEVEQLGPPVSSEKAILTLIGRHRSEYDKIIDQLTIEEHIKEKDALRREISRLQLQMQTQNPERVHVPSLQKTVALLQEQLRQERSVISQLREERDSTHDRGDILS